MLITPLLPLPCAVFHVFCLRCRCTVLRRVVLPFLVVTCVPFSVIFRFTCVSFALSFHFSATFCYVLLAFIHTSRWVVCVCVPFCSVDVLCSQFNICCPAALQFCRWSVANSVLVSQNATCNRRGM